MIAQAAQDALIRDGNFGDALLEVMHYDRRMKERANGSASGSLRQ
jgi:hypothetical protein